MPVEPAGTQASLAPFPFYTSQYSRYANMAPRHLSIRLAATEVPLNLLMCAPAARSTLCLGR